MSSAIDDNISVISEGQWIIQLLFSYEDLVESTQTNTMHLSVMKKTHKEKICR